MAKNRKFGEGRKLSLPVVSGTKSGDPVAVGELVGVALIDRAADGTATVDLGGAYDLEVKAIDGSGNSAVAIGDVLYYVSGDTPKLSKKNTGVRFGYALGAVSSGQSDTIPVKIGY